jgi:ribonuclease HII
MRRSYDKKIIVGVDEVGRGPLAGPITVAAIAAPIISKQFPKILKHIKNSKKLSPKKREEWNAKIREKFMYAVSSVGPAVIDRIGISRAARRAVARCLKKMATRYTLSVHRFAVVLDGGLYAPKTYPFQKTIIKGDERNSLIAAASIVAKVYRDACMRRLHEKFSLYGFDQHKGYGTAMHRRLLKIHGLCSMHRRSFCANIDIW